MARRFISFGLSVVGMTLGVCIIVQMLRGLPLEPVWPVAFWGGLIWVKVDTIQTLIEKGDKS